MVTTSATVTTTASVNAHDQQLIDMIKMKIDAMSLEKTKMIWDKRTMIKGRISSTHSQYWIVEWLDEYLQWSVNEKMMMNDTMMNEGMNIMDMTGSNTIAKLAMSNPDLSMLVDIVVFLGLDETLMAPGSLTVFAPTNAAFEQALMDLGITAEELMADKELLTDIIMYHVLWMKVTAEAAMSLDYGTLVETANGESLRVRSDESWVQIDGANVIAADMMASNGIVHVIDSVLLPPSFMEANGMMTDRGTMNLAEVAMWNDMFTTLVAWIQAADFTDMFINDWPWTVFAPTNDAFTKLLEANNMTATELLADTELLKSVLSYHVVSWFYTSQDIMGLDNSVMWTTANWAMIDIDPSGTVNGNAIIQADVFGSNWVIHVIDEVLMP